MDGALPCHSQTQKGPLYPYFRFNWRCKSSMHLYTSNPQRRSGKQQPKYHCFASDRRMPSLARYSTVAAVPALATGVLSFLLALWGLEGRRGLSLKSNIFHISDGPCFLRESAVRLLKNHGHELGYIRGWRGQLQHQLFGRCVVPVWWSALERAWSNMRWR